MHAVSNVLVTNTITITTSSDLYPHTHTLLALHPSTHSQKHNTILPKHLSHTLHTHNTHQHHWPCNAHTTPNTQHVTLPYPPWHFLIHRNQTPTLNTTLPTLTRWPHTTLSYPPQPDTHPQNTHTDTHQHSYLHPHPIPKTTSPLQPPHTLYLTHNTWHPAAQPLYIPWSNQNYQL